VTRRVRGLACVLAAAGLAVPAAGSAQASTSRPRQTATPPTAYVVNYSPGIGGKPDGTVTPIDTATNTAGTNIPVGTSPVAIAITP
jgi:YVTN family beta-propeller protein